MKNKVHKRAISFWNWIKQLLGRPIRLMEKHPVSSFVVVLVMLMGVIVASNYLGQPESAPAIEPVVKKVSTYGVGEAPTVMVQGRVEKSGVVPIIAQTAGVVKQIKVEVGQAVGAGTNLVSLVSTYAGGNAFGVQRQLAQTQYNYARDNLDGQKSVVAKQKEMTTTIDTNSDELRDISEKSVSETQALLELNESILSRISNDLDNLVATNSATGSNENDIHTYEKLKASYMSAVSSLKSSLRNLEYSTDTSKPPTQFSNLQKDITLEQLNLQEKALDLNLEVSRLQLMLARVNESLSYPVAPFAGVVERVFVKVGQAVSPGTPLLVLSGDEKVVTVVAFLSEQTARTMSKLEPSTIIYAGEEFTAFPTHIASEPTDGQLYAVTYVLAKGRQIEAGNKGFVRVMIPLGYPDTSVAVPFVPVDAVYQTSEGAFVYVVEDGVAVARQVELGVVQGSYVVIKDGLEAGGQIILDRNVVTGDMIQAI